MAAQQSKQHIAITAFPLLLFLHHWGHTAHCGLETKSVVMSCEQHGWWLLGRLTGAHIREAVAEASAPCPRGLAGGGHCHHPPWLLIDGHILEDARQK